jgi:hypothetical protein
MAGILSYLRTHRWQRRALTASFALVVGVATALVLYPVVEDWLLIADLGDADPKVRIPAIDRAIVGATRSAATLRRIEARLDTDDDVQFDAIVTVLERLGSSTPTRATRSTWTGCGRFASPRRELPRPRCRRG